MPEQDRQTKAPANDEVEVSLFGGGGGIGECVVVHVGNSQWIIVDSFLSKKSSQPVALEYLESLGVNISDGVKLVVATHWHSDHIMGIAQVFKAAQTSEFVISTALKADEVGILLQKDQHINTRKTPLNELNQIVRYALEKKKIIREAISDRLLWKGKTKNQHCTIYALSPSDAAVQQARKEFAIMEKEINSANRQIVDINPNHNSIVLRISIGEKYILLGSDLENTGNPQSGWSAVMQTNFKPTQNASVFKIPHHGSETSYVPEIWKNLLVPTPFAVLTPFKQGKVILPKKAYADKILEHTPHAYITSDSNTRSKPKKRDHKVEKTIRQLGYNPVEITYPKGHIRLRSKISQDAWEVERFGYAIPLQECKWEL